MLSIVPSAVLSIVLLIVLGMGIGSCGNANHLSGAIDATADASPEMTVSPPNCANASTVCDGKQVHACVGGQPGTILDICPDACSLGRCTSAACAAAEHHDGTRGCRFYGVQPDNVDSDDGHNLMLILGNASPTTVATATVTVSDSVGGWEPMTSAVVPPDGGARIEISSPVLESGFKARAFRVDTDYPVFAVEIVSDDVDRTSRSSGGTVLRPVHVLGFKHLAVTYPQKGSPEVLQTTGSRGGAGVVTVVATAPATNVTIGLRISAIFDPGGPIDPQPNPTVVLMNEGDVLQIFSATPDGDLTGTSIDANAPVAVFSGNVFTSYEYPVTGFNGGDLAMEQLPPTISWSYEYIGAALSRQSGCASFFGPGSSRWSVIAAEDDTEVTVKGARGITIVSDGIPAVVSFSLRRGQSRSFFSRPGPDPTAPTDFFVRSSGGKPILLAQWLDCEPALSLGIDTRLLTDPLAFTLPPGFDHEVVVVRRKGSPVTLDGLLLDDARFTSTLDEGEYELMRVGASELGHCGDLLDPCQHVISGPAFGIEWRGTDVVCSYALTVPPSDVCAPPYITCIP